VSAGRQALLAHRARLLERADFERAEFARLLVEWEKPLIAADRSLSFVRAVRKNPLVGIGVGAGMAALAVARPRSIMGWIVGGRAIWQMLTREVRRHS
jgi:hypothetical protein